MGIDIFNKYIWLISTIRRRGKISLKELKELYESNFQISEGEKFNSRTFHRWREKISEIFSIDILCSNHEYFIDNTNDLNGNNVRAWLMNTIATHNLITEHKNLRQRICVENYQTSDKFLYVIIYAMQDSLKINLSYKKFGIEEVTNMILEPYAIKSFKNRWYLLARHEDKGLRTYAFDRIEDIHTTQERFVFSKDFSADAYFMNYYGVIADESKEPERIELKVYGKDVNYLRTLPLHFTQKEILSKEDYSIFSLYMGITYDFVQMLLTFNSSLEVLQPQSLQEEIINRLQDTLKRYE